MQIFARESATASHHDNFVGRLGNFILMPCLGSTAFQQGYSERSPWEGTRIWRRRRATGGLLRVSGSTGVTGGLSGAKSSEPASGFSGCQRCICPGGARIPGLAPAQLAFLAASPSVFAAFAVVSLRVLVDRSILVPFWLLSRPSIPIHSPVSRLSLAFPPWIRSPCQPTTFLTFASSVSSVFPSVSVSSRSVGHSFFGCLGFSSSTACVP